VTTCRSLAPPLISRSKQGASPWTGPLDRRARPPIASNPIVQAQVGDPTADRQGDGGVGGAAQPEVAHAARDPVVWDTAPDRWSIELTGGASDLSVVEE
jgi:hypothetical protein